MDGDTADTTSENSTVSPSDAITDDDMAEAAAEEDGGSSISVSDLLLSTEPDETPAEYSLDPKIAHVIIAGKKMMRGAGANVQRGTTALENLIRAGVGFVTGGDDGDDGDGMGEAADIDVEQGGSDAV